MKVNLISGGFIRNLPWGTEHAFKRGLEYLGHEVVCVDPNALVNRGLDMKADATVVFKEVMNYELRQQLVQFEGPKLVYQPDDLKFPHIRDMMKYMLNYCSHAVIFEPDGVKTALELGYKSAVRIMLPVDTMIYREVPVPKVLDVCFVGNISNEPGHVSRRKMAEMISQETKLKSIVMSSFNVSQVVHLYNSSKIVLHHATDVGQPFGQGYGYQSRHFEAGFCGSCVLSNNILNEQEIEGLATFSSEESLFTEISALLKNDLWADFGKRYSTTLYELHRPEQKAQELVDFIRSCS